MRSQHAIQLCATAMKTAYLSSSCSSLLLLNIDADHVVCVVGKANGQIVLFPLDGPVCRLDRFTAPISALTYGDLRNLGQNELLAVAADGRVRSFSLNLGHQKPSNNCEAIVETFSQLLNANICAMHLLDIDNDGILELVVAMTDRVVRTYRFTVDRGRTRLTPLNKWEVPCEMTGLALGTGRGALVHALASQWPANYVQLEWGRTESDVRFVQAMAGDQDSRTMPLFLPSNVVQIALFHSLPTDIVVVDTDCNSETMLRPAGGPVIGVCHVVLTSNLLLIITIDLDGLLSLFDWSESLNRTDPVARCRLVTDVHKLSVVPFGPNTIIVAVVNVYCQLALYSLNLTSLLHSQS